MTVVIIRLLLDFGLVVLIWIIQRIVYPSFLHYSTENLVVWHREYTSRFSAIVIPLMLAQLGISIYQVITFANLYTVLSLVIIILIWISTFLQFVPIHANISKGSVSEKMLKALVRKNWLRTFLWSLLFVINFSYYILNTFNYQN
jgi:hypothetical protein